MAKYDEKFKHAVVQGYLSGAGGYKALGAKYGVPDSVVRHWVGRYRQHGDAGLSKKFSHYDSKFKLMVLQVMWSQELSYTEAAVMFDLRGGSWVVAGWERKYHSGGIDALEPKARGRPKQMKPPPPQMPSQVQASDTRTAEQLRQENEYLRAEVAYLKKLDALVRAKKQAVPTKRKP